MTTRKFARTLLVSVLALAIVLSVTGGTIAWFTDEVVSANNEIKAGNLDIALSYKNKLSDASWTEVKDESDPLFSYNLWEPGYTTYKYFRISNEGTLALQYRLHLNVDPATENADFNLADVIDVYLIPAPTAEITRADLAGLTPVGTLAQLAVENDGAAHGIMLPGADAVECAIVLKMQESAGNDYQNLSVGKGFALRLEATQYTHEEDSFGTDYDKGAALSSKVDSVEDLQKAFAEGGNVLLLNDLTLDEGVVLEVAEGANVILNMNGKTITGTSHKNDGAVVKNNGTLTVEGGVIASTANNGGSAIQNAGTLTVKNATLNGAPNADGAWPSYAVNNTGKATFENTTITSYHGAVASYGNGAVVTLNNSEIDMAGIPGFTSHGIYTYSNGSVIVNGGTYANKATDQNASGASVINGAVTVNAGTFSGRIENYYDTPVIKGGIFSVKPNDKYVADGFKGIEAGNYWVIVSENDDNGGLKEVKGTTGLFKEEDGTYLAVTQEAVDKAFKEKEATVQLMPGIYTNLPTPAEGVTIVGTEGVVFKDTLTSTLNNVTIKNITIQNGNAQRWAYATGKLVFENCTFDATGVYAIHYDGLNNADITYRNCKIIGWAAIGGGANSLTFENCEISGNGAYGLIRSYSDATIKDCTFDVADVNTNDVFQDGIHAVDCTIKVINCTNVNGAIEDILNESGTGKCIVE